LPPTSLVLFKITNAVKSPAVWALQCPGLYRRNYNALRSTWSAAQGAKPRPQNPFPAHLSLGCRPSPLAVSHASTYSTVLYNWFTTSPAYRLL